MDAVIVLLAVAAVAWLVLVQRSFSLLVGGLLVVLTGSVFGHPFFNFNVGPIPVTIDRVLLGLLVLASAVMWKMGRTDPKPMNRTDLLMCGLVVLLSFSTFTHDWQFQEKLPLSRLLFFNLLPLCLYLVAKQCHASRRELQAFYGVLAVFGLYLAATTIFEQRQIYQLVLPRYILDPEHWEFLGRGRGPFLNPVSCGMFLSVCLIACSFLWKTARPLTRVGLSVVIGLCLVASFLTLTRSVWLGCAVVSAIACWFPATNQARGGLIVAGTATLVFAAIFLTGKFGQFQRDKEVTVAQMAQSAKLRPMLAYVAIKMARDKPILGHGFGQYGDAKIPYHHEQTAGMQLAKVLPYLQHNVFLSYLTETGLIGLGLLCSLLTIFAFQSWSLWKSRSLDWSYRCFGLLGLAFISVYFINGMFHDVSIIPNVNAIFFLLLGTAENLCAQTVAVAGTNTAADRPGNATATRYAA